MKKILYDTSFVISYKIGCIVHIKYVLTYHFIA